MFTSLLHIYIYSVNTQISKFIVSRGLHSFKSTWSGLHSGFVRDLGTGPDPLQAVWCSCTRTHVQHCGLQEGNRLNTAVLTTTY